MLRPRLLPMAALLVLWPLLASAQFEPIVETRFDSFAAGEVAPIAQDLVLNEGDEALDSMTVDLDQGYFELDGLAVDDVIGEVLVLVEGDEIALPGGIIIEFDMEYEAEIVVTDIDEEESILGAEAQVSRDDDPTGTGGGDALVIFELTLTSFTDGSARVELINQVPLLIEGEVEWTWVFDDLYFHGEGDVLTVSTTLVSLDESEWFVTETFDVEGGDGSSVGEFRRGDVNGDGTVSAIADALFLLRWGLAEGEKPPCLDAADIDDSGTVSALTDALSLLFWQFGDEPEPADPGPEECGPDPDANDDVADCETSHEDCK